MMDSVFRNRIIIITAVALVHAALLFTIAFQVSVEKQEKPESAEVMKLVDISELEEPPPPPPPPPPEAAPPDAVESIAENMIETEKEPDQIVVAPGMITTPARPSGDGENYLPQKDISVVPKFDLNALTRSLVRNYPPIAQRAGIEGRVILELFIDRTGTIRKIDILREAPEGRGFGEAAVKSFMDTGMRCTPAQANGEDVSVRYRFPITFTLK